MTYGEWCVGVAVICRSGRLHLSSSIGHGDNSDLSVVSLTNNWLTIFADHGSKTKGPVSIVQSKSCKFP